MGKANKYICIYCKHIDAFASGAEDTVMNSYNESKKRYYQTKETLHKEYQKDKIEELEKQREGEIQQYEKRLKEIRNKWNTPFIFRNYKSDCNNRFGHAYISWEYLEKLKKNPVGVMTTCDK